jgi:hypothetical protein
MRDSSRSQAGFIELDDFGEEQRLAGDPAALHRAAHPFEDEALVRGVLVDQDEAVLGLGDDIGLGDLPARDAEREVDRLGTGRGGLGARRAAAG